MEKNEKIYTVHELSTLMVKNRKTERLYRRFQRSLKKWMSEEEFKAFKQNVRDAVDELNTVYKSGDAIDFNIMDYGENVYFSLDINGGFKTCMCVTIIRNVHYEDLEEDWKIYD